MMANAPRLSSWSRAFLRSLFALAFSALSEASAEAGPDERTAPREVVGVALTRSAMLGAEQALHSLELIEAATECWKCAVLIWYVAPGVRQFTSLLADGEVQGHHMVDRWCGDRDPMLILNALSTDLWTEEVLV